MKQHPKTFYIRTYGCQMNELDSEIMIGLLEKEGLCRVATEEEADLLLFNTCSIRDLSERKVMGKIGILSKRKRSNTIIGVTGCMATSKQGAIFEKLPQVDFVLGPNNIGELAAVIKSVTASEEKVLRTDHLFEDNIDYLAAKRDSSLHAYVSIIRGCDKHCTYCVVPYTRGREVSRAPQDIVAECTLLAQRGYKEITLLGQNVNSYGKDQPQWRCLFHDLLCRLDSIPGIERIRFMTSHPVDITLELMQAIRDLPSVCEFVHFPLQSGSDRILRKMHRIYKLQEYLEKVQMLKEIVPDVALGTDIIVGFPTETEEDFLATFHCLQQIEYSLAYVFAYSQRQGTPALRWKDDVPESIKQDRVQRLMQLQNQVCIKQYQQLLETEQEVLVYGTQEKDSSYLKGRTRKWQRVVFRGDSSMIGTLQRVHIDAYSHQTLVGNVVERAPSLLLREAN